MQVREAEADAIGGESGPPKGGNQRRPTCAYGDGAEDQGEEVEEEASWGVSVYGFTKNRWIWGSEGQ